jgi:hypothetical protein
MMAFIIGLLIFLYYLESGQYMRGASLLNTKAMLAPAANAVNAAAPHAAPAPPGSPLLAGGTALTDRGRAAAPADVARPISAAG